MLTTAGESKNSSDCNWFGNEVWDLLIHDIVTDAVLQSAEYREASYSNSKLSVVYLLDQINLICNSEFKIITGSEELK